MSKSTRPLIAKALSFLHSGQFLAFVTRFPFIEVAKYHSKQTKHMLCEQDKDWMGSRFSRLASLVCAGPLVLPNVSLHTGHVSLSARSSSVSMAKSIGPSIDDQNSSTIRNKTGQRRDFGISAPAAHVPSLRCVLWKQPRRSIRVASPTTIEKFQSDHHHRALRPLTSESRQESPSTA
jgi:hypothetical protein